MDVESEFSNRSKVFVELEIGSNIQVVKSSPSGTGTRFCALAATGLNSGVKHDVKIEEKCWRNDWFEHDSVLFSNTRWTISYTFEA